MSNPIIVLNRGSSTIDLPSLKCTYQPHRANFERPGPLFLPVFAALVPQMIVPYGGAASRHRVGLALPVGMRGQKARWTVEPKKEIA